MNIHKIIEILNLKDSNIPLYITSTCLFFTVCISVSVSVLSYFSKKENKEENRENRENREENKEKIYCSENLSLDSSKSSDNISDSEFKSSNCIKSNISKSSTNNSNRSFVRDMSYNYKLQILSEVISDLETEINETKEKYINWKEGMQTKIEKMENENKKNVDETEDNKKFLQILNHRITRLEDNFEDV